MHRVRVGLVPAEERIDLVRPSRQRLLRLGHGPNLIFDVRGGHVQRACGDRVHRLPGGGPKCGRGRLVHCVRRGPLLGRPCVDVFRVLKRFVFQQERCCRV